MPSNALTSEPVARVLSLLPGARKQGEQWMARCPAHDDRNPSLSIKQGDDGRALLYCHAGCATAAIVSALNLEERELFADVPAAGSRPTRSTPPRSFPTGREALSAYKATLGEPSALWTYRDADGSPVGIVARWQQGDRKEYRPAWLIDGAWQLTYPKRRPLYALPQVVGDAGPRVYVAEGEKAADALNALGLVATTSPGGAKAAERADWSPLAGREVVILPDADEAGRTYAEQVRSKLATLNPPARAVIVELPSLDEGEDAVEFIQRVHAGDGDAARGAVEGIATRALAKQPCKRVALVELAKAPGKLDPPKTIASGWRPFDRAQLDGAMERGTIAVLAAPPGCYKTATMLRIGFGFAENGHRVEWLAGEMRLVTLARRMAFQRARVSYELFLRGQVSPEERVRVEDAFNEMAALSGTMMFTRAPIGFDTLAHAADGCDVVFIDYLQLLQHPNPSVRGHERIEDAMSAITAAAQRTGAAFIIASAQGRDGGERGHRGNGSEERGIRNATRGSSSIEYSADALWCASDPGERVRRSGDDYLIEWRCLKQRDGRLLPLEVPIDGATGAIAEEWTP